MIICQKSGKYEYVGGLHVRRSTKEEIPLSLGRRGAIPILERVAVGFLVSEESVKKHVTSKA